MGKQYQTRNIPASMAGLDVSEQVSIALAEIAESAKKACSRWPWVPGCRCCRP